MSINMAVTLRLGRVSRRISASLPTRTLRSRAVSDHVPGGTAARNIHTADQSLAIEALRLALLGFQDARPVDELEFVGRRRQTADADAGKSAVLAVGFDPFGD